ncbi:glucan endo-1,6-beta-glucosidase [Mycena alexandri]|uniref:Glucan endo-1,6-beta-glucosidase n=1 Tax=Mycena alexandri TaxID=1745969 RepID=A0AAD6WZZ0_9AGAR|nr:glucan endo-1,6-beta-glucosidase [Mycena alexandri]
MHGPNRLLFLGLLVQPIASQQIYDVWQTTWDRSNLFSSIGPSSPINFVKPGATGSADIVVSDSTKYQTIVGFGGTLTDSSSLTLNNLKTKNSDHYWDILQKMFSPEDGADAAGLSYLRIPIGASDFSAKCDLDDVNGDTSFQSFSVNNAPSYLFSVISYILSINSILKVHIVPWSPPGWMKDSGTMTGGSLKSNLISAWLLNTGSHTFFQNEPQNSNPTYPSSTLTPATEGRLARDCGPFSYKLNMLICRFDHNWNSAAGYPVQLMQADGAAFDGDSFHSAFPPKNIYFTECSGKLGWWGPLRTEHQCSGLMFNIALDGNGQPMLPGTNSCGGECRELVTVNSDGSYSYNQEFYSLAQASKAIIPQDDGGPWGQRIEVSVGGSLNWALRVGAYATGRASSSDWTRYSLVVMNCTLLKLSPQPLLHCGSPGNDNASAGWNPIPVTTTIEFQGMQATYIFPVGKVILYCHLTRGFTSFGVTTLWWFASVSGSNANAAVN